MPETLEDLEDLLARLRVALREASRSGDREAMRRLRHELAEVDKRWSRLLEAEPPLPGEPIDEPRDPEEPSRSARPSEGRGRQSAWSLPIREQAHQALTVLGAPAGPKLISAAHEAFIGPPIVAAKLGSLRRDEERSYTAQPHGKPYYICPALTSDRLTPARGLLAVSTWPLEQRIVGPLGQRIDFLIHAARVAEQMLRLREGGSEPSGAAERLLRQFARSIPEASDPGDPFGAPDPERVRAAAESERRIHRREDEAERRAAATQARSQLPPVQQLFGAPKFASAPLAEGGKG